MEWCVLDLVLNGLNLCINVIPIITWIDAKYVSCLHSNWWFKSTRIRYAGNNYHLELGTMWSFVFSMNNWNYSGVNERFLWFTYSKKCVFFIGKLFFLYVTLWQLLIDIFIATTKLCVTIVCSETQVNNVNVKMSVGNCFDLWCDVHSMKRFERRFRSYSFVWQLVCRSKQLFRILFRFQEHVCNRMKILIIYIF